jgi:YVTN family beta-propeller protein
MNHRFAVKAFSSLLFCLSVGFALTFAQAQTPVGPQENHQSSAEKIVPSDQGLSSQSKSPDRTVGPQQDGSFVVSDNQRLTPAGKIVELGTPVQSKVVVINPNRATHSGAVLLMGSSNPIIVFDTVTGQVLQRFALESADGASSAGLNAGAFAGLTYSPDGTKLLFSQDNNHLVITEVNRKTGLLKKEQRIDLPKPPKGRRHGSSNPGGIAISSDGHRAYVVLNVLNTLGVIDLTASPAQLIGQISVGNAPNNVILHGNYAYVSNEGGRPATSEDFTNESDGTQLVVDRTDSFTITGTISVIDLSTGKEVRTISVGLHPVGMTISGSNLYVANAYSETLSVIDLQTEKVVRTIRLNVPTEGGGAFGAGPNDVAVTDDGKAYVTLGQANAVAVVNLQGRDANPVIGYIPTAYFPTSIAYDKVQKQLEIADDKGLGSRGLAIVKGGVTGYNTHADTGVVNLIPEPNAMELAKFSKQVFDNNHWNLATNIEVGKEYIDPKTAPVAVPRHIGEPSLIKHVFLIIKENRTYDQMLGDVAWGNGAPELAEFASAVPNQHAFVKRFPLLDNVYAPSRQSSDGHAWIVNSGSFYSNDIQAPDWVRAYGGDAMANIPRGFLWSAAEAKGLSVKIYGEWGQDKMAHKADGSAYTWSDFYSTAMCKEGKTPASGCVVPDDAINVTSAVPSAAKVMDSHYPPFDLGIPDQYRADYWIKDFQRLDASSQVPNLVILWLPDDHTSGISKGMPYPINYVADNDLALGRMVDAISHSKVWGQSAIFVEEDDSQSGADHVDGHRQPIYVISPYTASPQAPGQGKVIHTTYTAENINRTIENILGTQPLTQFDLVASPMFDAFQNTPDLTPYDHLSAVIPLDQGPDLPDGKVVAFSPMEKAWLKATAEVMKGKYDKADSVDPNFLNHADWYPTTGWNRPYPGEDRVLMPGPLAKAAKKYHDDDDD